MTDLMNVTKTTLRVIIPEKFLVTHWQGIQFTSRKNTGQKNN